MEPGRVGAEAEVEAPAPLTEAQVAAIRAARRGRRGIDGRCRFAVMNAVSFAVFALLSAGLAGLSVAMRGPGAVSSLVGMGAVVVLATVLVVELAGRAKLKRLEPAGAAVLGWNQLGLGIVLGLYFGLNVMSAFLSEDPLKKYVDETPALAETLELVRPWVPVVLGGIYGTLFVVVVPYQAAVAWYYFRGRRVVERYVAEVPGWARGVA